MAIEELSKKLFRLYPWIFLLIVIFIIISHFIYVAFVPSVMPNKEITINKGMKVREIAEILKKENIIRTPFYFLLLQRLIFPKEKIKSGNYSLSGKYSLIQVIKILKRGKGVSIVIPEGKTVKEIEKILQEAGFQISLSNFKLSDFPEINLINYFPQNAHLEGFLAPDSYHLYPNSNAREIVLTMLKNFQKKYLPEILKSDLDPYDTLILASIVEKEAQKNEDFPIISGILKKRLKNNMSLDVDSTIVYALCKGVYCQIKFNSQSLPQDNPYQTYRNVGLPPTPISNPGLRAINSVINPIETEYWYYLTTEDGKAIYATTLTEHQKNIEKYLR